MEHLEKLLIKFVDNYDIEKSGGGRNDRLAGGSLVVNDYMDSAMSRNSLKMGSVVGPPTESLNPFPELSEMNADTLKNPRFTGHFSKMRIQVEKFIKEWNEDDTNRDKTVGVLNDLSSTKEEMQETMRAMLERDGRISEVLLKGEDL